MLETSANGLVQWTVRMNQIESWTILDHLPNLFDWFDQKGWFFREFGITSSYLK